MSITAMTNVALARKLPVPARATVEKGMMSQAAAAAREGAGQPSAVTQALDVLTAYIPTEILTIYVATLAALADPAGSQSQAGWIAFALFFAATPIVVWLVYAAKVRQRGKPLPIAPSAWPKWEMIAAMIAFLSWAVALPGSPFRVIPEYNSAIAGILVMVTAAALGLITPVIHPAPEPQ